MQSTRRLKCLYRLSTHMHLTFCRCGTCVDGAKPGQHGYCPTRKRKRKLRKPPRRKVGGFRSNFQALSPNVGMPSTHENWGLCSMQCLPASISSLRTTTLQVQFWIFAPKTKLSLLMVFWYVRKSWKVVKRFIAQKTLSVVLLYCSLRYSSVVFVSNEGSRILFSDTRKFSCQH